MTIALAFQGIVSDPAIGVNQTAGLKASATVAFTYVNPSANEYQLMTPYWTDTSDGKVAGINFANLPTSSGP